MPLWAVVVRLRVCVGFIIHYIPPLTHRHALFKAGVDAKLEDVNKMHIYFLIGNSDKRKQVNASICKSLGGDREGFHWLIALEIS